MWKDVGLTEWYLEVEQTTRAAMAQRVLEMGANPDRARKEAKNAAAYARRVQDERMRSVRTLLKLPTSASVNRPDERTHSCAQAG
jgi:hypothetical protein